MYVTVLWQFSMSAKKDFWKNYDMTVWKDFDTPGGLEIEQRFRAFLLQKDDSQAAEYTYTWKGTPYHINFPTMTQTNGTTKNRRRVQRVLTKKSAAPTLTPCDYPDCPGMDCPICLAFQAPLLVAALSR
jgi:hypothetical protein